MAGIYIHIPFCRQACYYCDFHFSVNLTLKGELTGAIVKELILQKEYLKKEVIETIYLGGGTPSLLTKEELHSILDTIRTVYNVWPQAEITLEANPDDLSPLRLKEFREAGINRLSIGIQTFNSQQLKFLNRIHDETLAVTSFRDARAAGFTNISIDLMYALPGETDEAWKYDIHQAVQLNPEHISCYSLTIEEKTAFGNWASSGKLKPEPDEVSARHFELLMNELSEAGYEHYEISNFAKPGFYSNHNSSYWRGIPYLGVGPSAHSFNGESRQYNISNNHAYLAGIKAGEVPFEKEILTRENKINEYILTSLRTSWGTDLTILRQLHNYDLLAEKQHYISQLLHAKLLKLENHLLKLTSSGKLLADKISSDLFIA